MNIRPHPSGQAVDILYPVRRLLLVDVLEQPDPSVERWRLHTRVKLELTSRMFRTIIEALRAQYYELFRVVGKVHTFDPDGWSVEYRHDRLIEDSWDELAHVSARALYVRDKIVEDVTPFMVKAGTELQEYVRATTKNRINLIWSRGNE